MAYRMARERQAHAEFAPGGMSIEDVTETQEREDVFEMFAGSRALTPSRTREQPSMLLSALVGPRPRLAPHATATESLFHRAST